MIHRKHTHSTRFPVQALALQRRILILDEATAMFDPDGERDVDLTRLDGHTESAQGEQILVRTA